MARKLIRAAGRAAGPKGSWRRRFGLLLTLVIALGAAITVMGVHRDNVFELDRNVLDGPDPSSPPLTGGQDWINIYCSDPATNDPTDCPNTVAASTATADVFDTDPDGATIFVQGSSKDDIDTTGWKHETGSVPDKDEILHAYAARYADTLYFGADRFANNGDAVIGMWFFQEDVHPCNGTATGSPLSCKKPDGTAFPAGTFGPGQHRDGDILVVSDFTKGGEAVHINVYSWNGPDRGVPEDITGVGTIDGVLDFEFGSDTVSQDCVANTNLGVNDPACATVNVNPVVAPWPFTPKSGAAGTMAKGMFFEGGVDLQAIGFGSRCFASFLASSRTSQSTDARAMDFVSSGFESCESAVVTTPTQSTTSPVTDVNQITLGQSIRDYALVTGSGGGGAPTGTVTFFICSPAQLDDPATTIPGTNPPVAEDPLTCDMGGNQVGASPVSLTTVAGSTTQSEAFSILFEPTSIGTWCFRAEYSGGGVYPPAADGSSGECFQVLTLQPTIVTEQTWTLKDTAKITVDTGGGNLFGTLTFEVYVNKTDCTGVTPITTTINIPSPGTGLTETKDSNTLTVDINVTDQTYSWKVIYDSLNPAHEDVTSTCHTENSKISISGNTAIP